MANFTLPSPCQGGRYQCLVIDPPWDQGKTSRRTSRPNQGTVLDYPTMTMPELRVLPVPEWAADNALLWLWATNSRSRSSGLPILQQAFELLEAWDFHYYTLLTWDKSTGVCPFGPYQIVTEHCLFGYRGKFAPPRASMGKLQTLFRARSQRHSEKPACLYQSIATYFPGPRLDVFARRQHSGFDSWGNEVEQDESLQAGPGILQTALREPMGQPRRPREVFAGSPSSG